MSYKNDADHLYNKGKQTKAEIERIRNQISSLKKRRDDLEKNNNYNQHDKEIADLDKKIAALEAMIPDKESELESIVRSLTETQVKVNTDTKKYQNTYGELQKAYGGMDSKDNYKAKGDMQRATKEAHRKHTEYNALGNTITGYISSLQGSNKGKYSNANTAMSYIDSGGFTKQSADHNYQEMGGIKINNLEGTVNVNFFGCNFNQSKYENSPVNYITSNQFSKYNY